MPSAVNIAMATAASLAPPTARRVSTMNDSALTDSERPSRKGAWSLPRFRLKTLLVVFLVFSVVFAIGCWHLQRFRRQEAALRTLWQRSTFSMAWEEAQPAWLWSRIERWTGIRCAYATAISYSHAPWSMADVECIQALPRLRCLTGQFGFESDEVVERVAEITTLEQLCLRSFTLDLDHPSAFPSGRGVRALAALKNLKQLDLGTGHRGKFPFDTTATDENFLPIAESVPLEQLNLCGTRFTIAAIRPLLMRECLKKVILPPSFAGHVDELLKCRSLTAITIVRLPEHLRLRAPHRLYSTEQGGFLSLGMELEITRDQFPAAWRDDP